MRCWACLSSSLWPSCLVRAFRSTPRSVSIPKAIGDDPEAYLAREEAAVPDIRDGLEKEIIWANPMVHARTPLAIVYIHGFSASKGEVRPLPDKVADAARRQSFLHPPHRSRPGRRGDGARQRQCLDQRL